MTLVQVFSYGLPMTKHVRNLQAGGVNLLGLTDNTLRYGYHIIAWCETHIDCNYPPDPSPWLEEEKTAVCGVSKLAL